MSHHSFHPTYSVDGTAAGEHLRRFRQQAGLSQLDLSLIVGVSQRHLSCVETGRAKASPGTLHALLRALDVPLDLCNAVFVVAGYAPRYVASSLDAPAMEVVHDAINHILQANNPAPAIVISSNWDITAANASAGLLLKIGSFDFYPHLQLSGCRSILRLRHCASNILSLPTLLPGRG